MKLIFGYLAGLLFGLGLAIGGMTDPHRVQGFLDVFGNWDPTLIFLVTWLVCCLAWVWLSAV